MAFVRISCHADLQALQNRSDKVVIVDLLSLESVRIASDSCALLRDLIERKSRQLPHVLELRYWNCPKMELLSLVACVSLELQKVKHDLNPFAVQEASLEALLLLKNSGVALIRLAKGAKKILERCVEFMNEEGNEEDDVFSEEEDGLYEEEEDDLLLGKEVDVLLGKVNEVEKLGKEVMDMADLVLEGTQNIAWLKLRLPYVLEVVDVLLSTPVRFPHYQLFPASS